MYGIRGKFKISNITIPIYIDIMIDQKISGFVIYNLGPGWTPKPNSAPSITAVVPLPGIPRVSMGTNEPEQAALFAVSGADNPFTLPLPNFLFPHH